MVNENCDYCYSCDYCDFCNFCNYCNYCNSCDYCNSCNYCDYCKTCEKIVNGFMCINLKFDKKDKTKYWIFNKEVSREEWEKRWDIGKPKVCKECGQPLKKE